MNTQTDDFTHVLMNCLCKPYSTIQEGNQVKGHVKYSALTHEFCSSEKKSKLCFDEKLEALMHFIEIETNNWQLNFKINFLFLIQNFLKLSF